MNLTDMLKTITDRRAPVPPIPHLTTADLGIPESDLADRIESQTVTCKAMLPNPDGGDIMCGWEGIAEVAVFFDTGEHIWNCAECGNETATSFWPDAA